MLQRRMRFLAAGALATAGACASSPDGTSPENNPPVVTPTDTVVVSIELSPAAKTFRALMDTLRVTAAGRNAAGQVVAGRTVTWSTGNAAIATVSTSGTLTAAAVGETQVTASIGTAQATMTVRIDPWVAVAAATGGSVMQTCATANSGSIFCWAYTGGSFLTPKPFATGVPLVKLSGGNGVWCGLASDGTAYCWGENSHGEVGDGTRIQRVDPVPVTTTLKFWLIATQTPTGSIGSHACGLATDSTAHCWGAADQGQLGIGLISASTPGITTCAVSAVAQYCATSPRAVSGGRKYRSLSTGSRHTCAIGVDNLLYCWGSGPGSYTGNGSSVPTHPPPSLTFTDVAGRFEHSCAWTQGGDAYCWGAEGNGKLGGGPTPVQNLA